jgi:Rrf2 family protein
MQILKDLHRAGILGSVRGAGGGYFLARPPEQITLRKVIDAIEGHTAVTACCADDEPDACNACIVLKKCPITTAMRRLNERIVHLLSQVTIRDLLDPDSLNLVPLQHLDALETPTPETAPTSR